MKSSRKLAAIMFTDIEGYTAMMQENEQQALQIVAMHENFLHEIVPTYDGEIQNIMGDGSLCLFSSATAAVRCARELQLRFSEHGKIPIRIGIDEGEVIIEGTKAYGDSVNMASRIESAGHAGLILISENVRNKIANQVDLPVISVGLFELKNVNKPRELFAVQGPGLPQVDPSKLNVRRSHPQAVPSKNKRKRMLIYAIPGGVALLSFIIWKSLPQPPGQWLGEWDFIYYYENDSSLKYTGTADIYFEDSLQAIFEIYPPQSHRPERATARSLRISGEDDARLSGELVHEAYRIRGGYMRELFTFERQNGTFKGSGRCVQYCAEGTSNLAIHWQGSESDYSTE